jgi:2,5-diketo-D-gluconate reductase B
MPRQSGKNTRKTKKQRGGEKPTPIPENPTVFTDGFPVIGFGTSQMPKAAIRKALESGYTCLDCAYNYENSAAVVRAIAESKLPRAGLFIIGKGDTIDELASQCETVGGGYLDLALIHSAGSVGMFDEHELLTLWTYLSKNPAKFRRIGVSNMYSGRLIRFQKQIREAELRPIEVIENEMRPGIADTDFLTMGQNQKPPIHFIAYSTLRISESIETAIDALKATYLPIRDYTWAEISLKWAIQQGITVIPSSKKTVNIVANLSVIRKPDLPTEVIDALNKLTTERTVSNGFKQENNMYWSLLP